MKSRNLEEFIMKQREKLGTYPSTVARSNTFATFSRLSQPFHVWLGQRAKWGTICPWLSRNLSELDQGHHSQMYKGLGVIDSPFIALREESSQGFDPTLSGKNPLVPPTATFKMR